MRLQLVEYEIHVIEIRVIVQQTLLWTYLLIRRNYYAVGLGAQTYNGVPLSVLLTSVGKPRKLIDSIPKKRL